MALDVMWRSDGIVSCCLWRFFFFFRFQTLVCFRNVVVFASRPSPVPTPLSLALSLSVFLSLSLSLSPHTLSPCRHVFLLILSFAVQVAGV